MKRNRFAIVGLVIGLLLGIYFVLPLVRAIGWHIFHGSNVTLGRYTIIVPFWTYAQHDGNTVSILSTSATSRRSAQTTFSLQPIEWSAREKEMMQNFDFQRLETSTRTIAGEEKSCWLFRDARVHKVHIICNNAEGTDGLESRFVGDEDFAGEYYKTLSAIEKLK